jgi:uncharacterized protein (DUF2062 family)
LKAATLRLGTSILNLSGDSIAIILAVGLVLGTFPIYGGPTVLCLLAVLVFRLNAPALHLVNQLACPLQVALLIPFARLGAHILGPPATVSNSVLHRFGELTLQAVAGWLCVSVPLGVLLYVVLSCTLRRHRPSCFNELENPAQ